MTRCEPMAPSVPHHRQECVAEPKSPSQASAPFSQSAAECVVTETRILFFYSHLTWCDVRSAVFSNAHSMSSPPTTQVCRSCRQAHTSMWYGNFIDTGKILCDAEKRSFHYPRQQNSLNVLDPPQSPTATISSTEFLVA